MKKSRFILSFIDSWWSKHTSVVSYLLIPWSILFLAIVVIRRWFYRLGIKKTTTFNVPIIIVGNIVVGGTGKTPLVIYLARLLKEKGFNPGIVSRGYGANRVSNPRLVLSTDSPSDVGDEPVLIASRTDCPVVISVNRPEAVKHLIEKYQCNIVLSDDGMQHYAMARDLEIVVVDGVRLFGNGLCLPAGPLREPLFRLNKVKWIVSNGKSFPKTSRFSDQSVTMELIPKRICSVGDSNQCIDVNQLQEDKVHAVAGIGNPKRFFNELRELGLQIIEHPFPDHYRFTKKDIDFAPESKVIMTEKDAVKCRDFADSRHFFVPVEAELPAEFDQQFLSEVSRIKALKDEDKK